MDEKTFWEHLEELRRYVIWILVWFGVAFILAYQLAPKLLNVIAKDTRLYFFAPWEPFLVRLRVGVWVALYLTLPFIAYQGFRFLKPGLKSHELRMLRVVLGVAIPIVFGSVLIAYFYLIPVIWKVLLNFAAGQMLPVINVSHYLTFFIWLTIASGVLILFPICIVLSVEFGVVPPDFYLSSWRYVIVTIFIISALLTPPDIFTQLLMAIPFVGLYLIALAIIKKHYREAL